MKIRNPQNTAEIKYLENLWLENFQEDTNEYVTMFFSEYFNKKNCLLLCDENEEIISSLQFRIYDVQINNSIIKIPLIFAIITVKKHRGKGYMKKILNHALENNLKEYKDVFIQAYNWDIYKKFGFQKTYFRQKLLINIFSFKKALKDNTELLNPNETKELKRLQRIYNNFCLNKEGYAIRDLNYFEEFVKTCNTLSHKLFLSDDAYVVLDEKTNVIKEMAYVNFYSLAVLFSKLDYKNIRFSYEACLNETELINCLFCTKSTLVEHTETLFKLNKTNSKSILKNNLYFNES